MNINNHILCVAVLLPLGCLSASCSPNSGSSDSVPEESEAQISIQADASGIPVNQKVFGQFIRGADTYGIFSIPHPDLAAIREGNGIWNPDTESPFPGAWDALKSYRPGALRFPGGLSVHNYDWKKTIGPVEERDDWKFGLDEFMQISQALGADPIIVISEYTGGPQDAADLVEYLNMPAEEKYPWAMKRSANGHPDPYDVAYFEIGNESWVDWRKNVQTQVRPPAEVGSYASEIAAAMKAVDPDIKCGVPYEPHDNAWSKGVLSNITDAIDFVIVHTYPVKYGGRDMNGTKEQRILEAMMAAGYITSQELLVDEDKIAEITGRLMPLAITEYNLGPTQQQPDLKRPYRFTLAAALGGGDYLGRLMDPEYNVCTAVYWSWLNGFFGAVETYSGHPWKTLEKLEVPKYRPVHYIFQLWGRYRGETLLPVEVQTETLEFSGYSQIKPALGEYGRFEEPVSEENIFAYAQLLPVKNDKLKITPVEGGWDIQFDGITGSDYSDFAMLDLNTLPPDQRPPQAGLIYKVEYQAKWEPQSGNKLPNLGIGLMDNRGYSTSGSAIGISGAQAAMDWTRFEGTYQPLEDTRGLVVLTRLIGSAEPVFGTLRIRDFKIIPWLSEAYPARPALSAYATRSGDGKRLYLVVFNLTLDETITAKIDWTGFEAQTATYSEINAPSAATTNLDESEAGWVVVDKPVPLVGKNRLTHTFSAHSATGFVIETGQ